MTPLFVNIFIFAGGAGTRFWLILISPVAVGPVVMQYRTFIKKHSI